MDLDGAPRCTQLHRAGLRGEPLSLVSSATVSTIAEPE
jgi:hypothetical protein